MVFFCFSRILVTVSAKRIGFTHLCNLWFISYLGFWVEPTREGSGTIFLPGWLPGLPSCPLRWMSRFAESGQPLCHLDDGDEIPINLIAAPRAANCVQK